MKNIIKDKFAVIARYRNLLGYYDEIYVDNLIKGWTGEEMLRKLISEKYMLSQRYLQNLYLKTNSACEVDGMIMLREKLVVVEVKHYSGFVEIDGWETRVDGRLVEDNPMLRTNKMINIVENIVQNLGLNIEVEVLLVFTHPDCDVRMNSPIKCSCILSNQIRRYLTALANEADKQHYTDQEFNYLCDQLNRYSYKYTGQRLKPENFKWEKLQAGLACPNCKKLEMNTSQYTCQCRACGSTFSKNETVRENIIDYCILHKKNEFTTTEIRKFVGGGVSRHLISRVAKRYFTLRDTFQRLTYIVDHQFLE